MSSISDFFKDLLTSAGKKTVERSVTLPNGKAGHVILDAEGNESIIYTGDVTRVTNMRVATVKSFVDQIGNIGKLFGPQVASMFREVYVVCDESNIPETIYCSSDTSSNKESSRYAVFRLETHPDLAHWAHGKKMTQTQFQDLLFEHMDQHDQPNLPALLSVINYKVEIDYTASSQNERGVVLAYTEKEQQGSVQIPLSMNVNVPVILGAETTISVEFAIKVYMPKDKDEQIMFRLKPVKEGITAMLHRMRQHVVDTEVIPQVLDAIAANGAERVEPIYSYGLPTIFEMTDIDKDSELRFISQTATKLTSK